MAGVCGSASPLALCEFAGTAVESTLRIAKDDLLARPLLVLLAAVVQVLFCALAKSRTPRYDPAKGRLEYLVFFWAYTLAVDLLVGTHTLLTGARWHEGSVKRLLLGMGYTALGTAQVWLCGAGVLDVFVDKRPSLRRRTRARLAALCSAACVVCTVLGVTAAHAPRRFPSVAVGVVASWCFGYVLTQIAVLVLHPSFLGWVCSGITLVAHATALVLACHGGVGSRWFSGAELALAALSAGHLVHFATFPLHSGGTRLVHVLNKHTTLRLDELARRGG